MDPLSQLAFLAPPALLAITVWRAVSRRELRELTGDWWFLALVLVAVLGDRWLLGFASKDLLFIQRELAAELALGGGGNALVSTTTGLGKPIFAHPLMPVFHPFAWILRVPASDLAVHLYVAAHVVWGAAWWWLLLAVDPGTRRGSRNRWWIRSGVLLAMLNGFIISRISGYHGMEYAFASMWLPQVLYGIVRLVRRPGADLVTACLVGLGWSSMMVSCPNVALVCLPVVALFALLTWVSRGVPGRPALVGWPIVVGSALTAAVTLVLALPEVVPAIEVLLANDGFTYRIDAASSRFRPYTADELWHTFSALGQATWGRRTVVGLGTWAVLAGAGVLSRRVRPWMLAGTAVILLGAIDWACGGPTTHLLLAIVPFASRITMSPTVQLLFSVGVVGCFAAICSPRIRRPRWADAIPVMLAMTLMLGARELRVLRGYDLGHEAGLFAWTTAIEHGSGAPLVAVIEPISEHSYLIPDPIARVQGLRTLGEDWYSLLPRDFYDESLVEWYGDWDRMYEMGVSYIVSTDPTNRAPETWELVETFDALSIAAAAAGRAPFFESRMALQRKHSTDWDGHVYLFCSRSPAPATPPELRHYEPSLTTEIAARSWLVLGLVLIPLLARRRRLPLAGAVR